LITKMRCSQILIGTMLVFMLGVFSPSGVQADTNLNAIVSDPDNPQGSGDGEGNTINTVLSAPTVTMGTNQELGTIRIIGKPGIAVPIQAGQKVMLTLPSGTAYMQIANSSNYQKYVECPEMVDGHKNQLATTNGLPGIKLVAATPRSITVEISYIDSDAPLMALDFIFNQDNYSKVRVASFVEKVEEYMAKPNDNISRLEFFQLLSRVIERFSPAVTSPDQHRGAVFSDTVGLDPADLSDISVLTKSGLLQGNGNNLLRPNDYISRIEAASILGRAFPAQGEWAVFSDPIPAWAKADINSAFAGGIISGYADGSFRPNNLLSKNEAITLLQRSLESYSF